MEHVPTLFTCSLLAFPCHENTATVAVNSTNSVRSDVVRRNNNENMVRAGTSESINLIMYTKLYTL